MSVLYSSFIVIYRSRSEQQTNYLFSEQLRNKRTTKHVKLSLSLTFQYLYIPFVLLYIIEQGTIHQHDFENNNHFCTQPKQVSFVTIKCRTIYNDVYLF
jgi:hypothetical protein